MQKNDEGEINALKKQLQEKEDLVRLLKDAVELRDNKIDRILKTEAGEKIAL
ncbi:hypothetical protein [Niabella ginsengisoli]|uniref:Uncharacterized protein n=1 Tax=Niabella ginsengisoli TaxID=522298 RepID=A0ABS9SMD1_9BACT|nr:hypothetical protein [Niabella ginsengisoli]MCH5599517.1 hypothetical protein [Niabella ginsengisoli]